MSETTTFTDPNVLLDRPDGSSKRTLAKPKPASAGVNSIIASAITIVLMLLSAAIGMHFWTDWFSSIDRIACSLFAFLGLGILLVRSNWDSDAPTRKWSPIVLWSLSAAVLLISLAAGRPKLTGISMGLAAAGWFASQMRGESIANAVAMGMAFMIPSWVDACKDRGIFNMAEHVSVLITSGLADTLQQCNIVEGNTILFGHGAANKFSCEGTWDSIVTFMGISLFCIYVFRRSLLSGLITFSLSFVVWMALRGAAWVSLSYMASINGHWYEWPFSLDIILFIIGTLFIFSLDQFFATLLKPIPLEFVNPDFPLAASAWNWFAGLPQLSTPVPNREFEITESSEEGSI